MAKLIEIVVAIVLFFVIDHLQFYGYVNSAIAFVLSVFDLIALIILLIKG